MAAPRRKMENGQFAAMLSAAIAFAGVLISGTNVLVAYINKSKDLDIAARKEFREFVTKNRTVIYGVDRLPAEQIRNVMRITFPEELWKPAFVEIQLNVPRKNQDLFSTKVLSGYVVSGTVGIFGGPDDNSYLPSEGLALIAPSHLPNFSKYFLPAPPPGTDGLARRLNPESFYMSARWNYDATPREFLRSHLVTVTNPTTGKSAEAQPVEWGPSERTGNVAAILPGLARKLDVTTGQVVTILVPVPGTYHPRQDAR